MARLSVFCPVLAGLIIAISGCSASDVQTPNVENQPALQEKAPPPSPGGGEKEQGGGAGPGVQ